MGNYSVTHTAEYMRAWRIANPKRCVLYNKRKRRLHPEKYKAIALRYRIAHKAEIRESHKRYRYFKYGWTKARYDEIYYQQSGRCAICSKTQKDLYIDHDHRSDKTRGLLCKHCNWGLGHFRDTLVILESAANYLRQWGIIQ